jgi:hypothetical protein
MLKYSVVKNATTANSRHFVAHVSSPESKTLDDVIKHMISEGTGLTRPQALAYFEKLTQSFLFFVGQGHHVITPLVKVRPTISGIFVNKLDNFDSSRHQVNIRSTSGIRLRELETDIKLEKVNVSTQMPVPILFTDSRTGEENFWATSGEIGALRGQLLKFDPKDLEQGIFFVPIEDPGTEIRAELYSRIKPAEVNFQVPVLASGEYKLVVKTIPKEGKGIKTGELETVLNVI